MPNIPVHLDGYQVKSLRTPRSPNGLRRKRSTSSLSTLSTPKRTSPPGLQPIGFRTLSSSIDPFTRHLGARHLKGGGYVIAVTVFTVFSTLFYFSNSFSFVQVQLSHVHSSFSKRINKEHHWYWEADLEYLILGCQGRHC